MENKIIISNQNENRHCERILKQSMLSVCNDKIHSRKKPAMTLAEILVVITIISIIGGIFLAMPKKNISQTDRAKYYIAYSILQRLINEQLVDENKISLNTTEQEEGEDDDKVIYESFGKKVDKWLNVASSCSWNENNKCIKTSFSPDTSTNAILTNGMYLDWRTNNNLDKNDTTHTNKTIQKGVYFDIDGVDEGKSAELKDIHYFVIYEDGRVKPALSNSTNTNINTDINNSGWIGFKVYKIGNNSKINIILMNAHYDTAYGCFTDTTDACNHKCNSKDCFMEAVQPMKL